MKTIEFTDPHRIKHFRFFQEMEMPHFSIVAQIPFAQMHKYIKDESLHFTSAVVYLISKSANAVPELRWRIRGDTVVEHPVVHPSFSVQTRTSDVFSFCYVDYVADFRNFQTAAKDAIAAMQHEPSLEDEEGRDDFLFLSSIPWVHFTGLTHAMQLKTVDSVPRITWGKLGPGEDGRKLPLGLQVHHGVVDGKHAGRFYEEFTALCQDPANAFS